MHVTMHHQTGGPAVLVYLHGRGEIGGKEPARQVRVHGPWQEVEYNPSRQYSRWGMLPPKRIDYSDETLREIKRFHILGFHLSNGSVWGPSLGEVDDALDAFIAAPANGVDKDRIYLTGLSIGGAGACMLADIRLRARKPVAAVAAFCPAGWEDGYPDRLQQTVGAIRTYLFCSSRDRFYNSTKALGTLLGGSCQMRDIGDDELAKRDSPHNCWTRRYGSPEFYRVLDRTDCVGSSNNDHHRDHG